MHLTLLKNKIAAIEENFVKFRVTIDGLPQEFEGRITKREETYLASLPKFRTQQHFTITKIITMDSKNNILEEFDCSWSFLPGDIVYFSRELLNVR